MADISQNDSEVEENFSLCPIKDQTSPVGIHLVITCPLVATAGSRLWEATLPTSRQICHGRGRVPPTEAAVCQPVSGGLCIAANAGILAYTHPRMCVENATASMLTSAGERK